MATPATMPEDLQNREGLKLAAAPPEDVACPQGSRMKLVLDDIDLEFASLRGKVGPEWYAKLLPLVRTRYRGASTQEIDAATIEACLWADPLTRPKMKDAVILQDDLRIEAEMEADADHEPMDRWMLRHVVNDALKDFPDE